MAALAGAPYLRDLADHVHAMLSTSDGAATMLEALQATYLSQLQMRAEAHSRALNDMMKKLSAFATIMLPLTLISGILGMNVSFPWTDGDADDSHHRAFWATTAVMVGVVLFMTLAMKYRGYI